MTIATIPYLKETLALLPPQSGALAQVASTLRLWRNITHRDPTAEHARPDRVVEVILQLPNEPASYIRLLTDRGLPNLNAMFHPNTLRRAKHDTALRGLFAGTNDYWEDTKKQLTVITE